jgi:hypothetical protein
MRERSERMFYMETVYLQMAASRELAKEQLRRHDEQDDHRLGPSSLEP